jgi:hypothetical protein
MELACPEGKSVQFKYFNPDDWRICPDFAHQSGGSPRT